MLELDPILRQIRTNLSAILESGALQGSMANFTQAPARYLTDRAQPFFVWQQNRRRFGLWPFSNAIRRAAGPTVEASADDSRSATGLNFASQDYLSLSSHPNVRAAASEVIDRYGVHSAGSPCLQGNTPLSLQLEQALCQALGFEEAILFPTGWAAGYGSIAGLVRPTDHVILDQYAHNCLVQGAQAATPHVSRVRHLDLDACAARLRKIRKTVGSVAILVVTEGLFSMDADSPDLAGLHELCRQYEANLLVDMAHDFGALGPDGTGIAGRQGMLRHLDFVMGSFSKTFASNGGFLLTRCRAVKEYVKFYSAPFTFSNALSPIQCAVVLEALRIVRSKEGDERRGRLLHAVNALRRSLMERGIECMGNPSPIVPVPLGTEAVGRLAALLCFQAGLFANLVEYPAVSVGMSRFRMQVMADHTPEQSQRAADVIVEVLEAARNMVGAGVAPRPEPAFPEDAAAVLEDTIL